MKKVMNWFFIELQHIFLNDVLKRFVICNFPWFF